MPDAILQLKNVTKRYTPERISLIARELDIFRGELLAIVGPSGGGKSTLVNIIAGFINPDSGEILKDGKPLPPPGPDRMPVFQNHALFPWFNVWENIAYGLKNTSLSQKDMAARVQEALETVNLENAWNMYPAELSGGMSQRAALARAIVMRPDILLLDEPFASLDEGNRARLHEELIKIRTIHKPTILMVTHNLDEALKLADRVALLLPPPVGIADVVTLPELSVRKHSPEIAAIRKSLAARIADYRF